MHHIATHLMMAIQNSSILGYIILFFVFFFESLAFVGIMIPGTIFLVLSGFLAAREIMDTNMLLLTVMTAIVIGDGLSYYLGEQGKSFFRGSNKIFKSSYLEKGENFFRSHGNKSVILGRFIGPIRPFISFIAGLFKMDIVKFYIFNIIGAALWVLFYFSLGFFFGQAARTVEMWFTRVGMFLFVLVLFFVAFYILKNFITRRSAAIFLFLRSVSSSIMEGIMENEDVRKIIENHPRTFLFLKKRFERGVFTGLPLTFLALAFVYVAALFLGVVEDVMKSDIIVSVDMRIVNLMDAFRDKVLVKFFLLVTVLGEWQLILVFTAIVTVILWIWKKRFYIISLWTTMAGSMVFAFIGKLAFRRARPINAVYFEKSFSFPSGHATVSMAFFGFLIYFLWMNLPKWKSKINALFANLFLIIIIGFSRLYLGVHYFSDVWAGYLLGLLWLIIGVTLGEWLYSKIGGAMMKFAPPAKIKLISFGLVIMGVVSYVAVALTFKPILLPSEAETTEQSVADYGDIFSANKLPKYSETLFGNRQEPLGFVVMAKKDSDLQGIFEKAGWYLPDDWSLNLIVKMSQAALSNESFPRAPITPSFWNTQVNDLAFQKPTRNNSIKERHHIRFWDTHFETKNGDEIFVGTASLDVGLKWWITHRINPDIDTERDYVFNDLLKTGLISSWKKEKFVDPVLGTNFTGDQFFTDGEVYIIYLR